MATVEKRNGVWYARYKDFNGQWKYKSCGKGITKKDAILQASALEHCETTNQSGTGLVALLEEFQETGVLVGAMGFERAKTTIKREKDAIEHFIRYVKQHEITNVHSVTPKTIIRFMHERGDIVSPKTVKEERRVVNVFFNRLVDEEVIVKNPVSKVPAPFIPKTKKRFFSEKELEIIFSEATDEFRPVFQFLYYTGLRISELKNLQWDDWDEVNHLLIIRGSHTTGGEYERNKFRHDTQIPTSIKVEDILQGQRGNHPKYVFTRLNRKMSNNTIYKHLYTILKKNNIRNASPHTFRHTCGSHLVQRGISIYKVSKYLRHSSISMTEVYAHLQPDNLIDDVGIL